MNAHADCWELTQIAAYRRQTRDQLSADVHKETLEGGRGSGTRFLEMTRWMLFGLRFLTVSPIFFGQMNLLGIERSYGGEDEGGEKILGRKGFRGKRGNDDFVIGEDDSASQITEEIEVHEMFDMSARKSLADFHSAPALASGCNASKVYGSLDRWRLPEIRPSNGQAGRQAGRQAGSL